MKSARVSFARKAAVVFFIFVFAAMMWPIYPMFSRIHPLILGVPFSLFYLIILIMISFLVLLGLYILEKDESEI